MSEPALRLDKWLWYARFFKTRSLATQLCNSSRLRADGTVVSKAHQKVRPGDILTFPQGRRIRVVKVLALATRRGPAAEARLLYQDLDDPDVPNGPTSCAPRPTGMGRPTKRERRSLDRLREVT